MNYDVITIEREYASGGREVGRLAAQQLNIPCYGGQLLQHAARSAGMDPAYVESLDETAPNGLQYSLNVLAHSLTLDQTLSPRNALQQAEAGLIRRLADRGGCLIIGRCAGAILRDRPNVLRVFVRSDLKLRRARAVKEYGIPEDQADAVLRRYDRRRASYYAFYSEQKWADMAGYHMVLDSGKLGLGLCAGLVARAAQ